MATINIKNLQPAGSSLFLDEESYLEELSDDLSNGTHGGAFFTLISPASPQIGGAAVATFVASAGLSFAITRNWRR